jgi:DNA repair photolyase
MFHLFGMDCDEITHLKREIRPGRAASSNDSGRFERYGRVAISDGWEIEEDLPILRTEVSRERPRSAITRNKSPDLPFDRSLNPYRGCEHGCIYCFARPSHAYLGLSPGLDFETRLVMKPGIAEVLDRELRRKSYRPAVLAIGSNTDPYQPLEKSARLMREVLEVLWEFRHPVAIVTKGALIGRDLDILSDMAALDLVQVGVSVTTLDAKLARAMEPRVPTPARRLAAIRALSEAGVPVRVMAAPMIPALTDPELEAILEAGAEAGARMASWIMLRLPREVSPLFQDWLGEHFPDRAGRIMARLREMHRGEEYSAEWFHRMRGEGHYAELVGQRFQLATRRFGLSTGDHPLRTDLFRIPFRRGNQLSLF